MAQRFVVNVLECNKPMLDEELNPEDEEAIIKEYDKMNKKLIKQLKSVGFEADEDIGYVLLRFYVNKEPE